MSITSGSLTTRQAVLLTLALLAGASRAGAGDAPAGAVTVYPVRIDMQAESEGVDGQSLRVAPRCAHVAWRAEREGAWAWHVDGKRRTGEGGAYEEVGPLVFAPDGASWAHLARRKATWLLVLDGAEQPLAGLTPQPETLRLLPGPTARAVFRATRVGEGRTGETLVVGGVEGPAFSHVLEESLVVSLDGRRHAYKAADAAGERVIVDGTPHKTYPKGALGTLAFSGDGAHVAYDVRVKQGRALVLDGVEGEAYGFVSPPLVAEAGPRVAVVTQRGGKAVVLVDGKPGPEVSDLLAPGPVFSADGQHVAYAATSAGGFQVVIDGVPGPLFPRLGSESLRLSPDGKRHMYWAGKGRKPFLVLDGVAQKEVDEVGAGDAYRFSPDSRRAAYAVRRGGKWVVVTDGQEGPETDGIGQGFPRFSPDSRHVVYQAKVSGRWHLVVDGALGPAFDGFAQDALAFGQDGASVGVVARRGSDWRIVVDGREGEAFQALLPGAGLAASGPRAFRTFAMRGAELLRVETSLP